MIEDEPNDEEMQQPEIGSSPLRKSNSTTYPRAAVMEAIRLLDGETSAASQQARRLLLNAFSTELPSVVCAALDAKPAVQAALQRIAIVWYQIFTPPH